MDRETFPVPEFTHAELKFLQDTLDELRAITFNELMEAKHRDLPTEVLEYEYRMSRTLRDKVYHLGGRDTLALGEDYHEVRWWDQQHDY
ncbi:hypothetical protein [Synechococcus phage MA10]